MDNSKGLIEARLVPRADSLLGRAIFSRDICSVSSPDFLGFWYPHSAGLDVVRASRSIPLQKAHPVHGNNAQLTLGRALFLIAFVAF